MSAADARSLAAIRNEILAARPGFELSRRHPVQILWFPTLATLATAFGALSLRLPLAGALLASIALGLTAASLGLFTHELLHGSIIRVDRGVSGVVARLMAFAGFLIFGLSPELWLTWHNRVHHFHTNEPGADPDSFGLWERFKTMPMSGFVLKRAPGSGHWLSWLYLPLNFSNQVLTVMWFFLWKADRPELYARVKKTLAVAETLAMYAIWVAVGVLLGARALALLLIVPALVANLIVSSYILVQHLLCPLTQANDPLENTLGVSTHPWLDRLHFRFSHHVEHHLFPELNHVEHARLRSFLRARYPERYRMLSHARAIQLLMSTPRVYADADTLLDPANGARFDVGSLGQTCLKERAKKRQDATRPEAVT